MILWWVYLPQCHYPWVSPEGFSLTFGSTRLLMIDCLLAQRSPIDIIVFQEFVHARLTHRRWRVCPRHPVRVPNFYLYRLDVVVDPMRLTADGAFTTCLNHWSIRFLCWWTYSTRFCNSVCLNVILFIFTLGLFIIRVSIPWFLWIVLCTLLFITSISIVLWSYIFGRNFVGYLFVIHIHFHLSVKYPGGTIWYHTYFDFDFSVFKFFLQIIWYLHVLV